MDGNAMIIRANPYPPNFSSTAANTIDPATGASTWAFGSHKCTRNSGSLTMNAIIDNSHKIDVPWKIKFIFMYRCLDVE